MSELKEIFIDRVITKPEADEVVGKVVEAFEPNVTEAGLYRDRATGEAILLYAPVPGGVTNLRRTVLTLSYGTTLRASGTRNVSKVFGFTTRSAVLRRESCTATALGWESPEAQMVLNDMSDTLGGYLKEMLPEVYLKDVEQMEAVLPEWRMTEDALWTSGVINQSSSLPYHRDGSNFDTWSAMPVVRRGMDGGDLHMPEYGITIACKDGWALWFNGHAYVHGVTPMKSRAEDGYRYSVVFYAKRGMKDCHTYAQEIGEARARRTERELSMADTSIEHVKSKIKTGRSNGSTAIVND